MSSPLSSSRGTAATRSFDSEFWQFLLGRLLIAILTLLAVSFMIYGLIELMPGDYAERELFRKYSGTGVTITQSDIDQVRANLGLDRPFLVRYGEWLWNVVTRLDFGPAFRVETSVNSLIQAKFLYTFVLVVGAMLFSYIIAVPVGIWVATRKSGLADGVVTLLSYLGLALPNFAIALVLLMLNAFVFKLDVTGLISQTYRDQPWSMAKFLDFLGHAYIPLACSRVVHHRLSAPNHAGPNERRTWQTLCHRRQSQRSIRLAHAPQIPRPPSRHAHRLHHRLRFLPIIQRVTHRRLHPRPR